MNTYKAVNLLCEKLESEYRIICPDCNYEAETEKGSFIVGVGEHEGQPAIESDFLVCEDGQIIQVIQCPKCGSSLVVKGE